ncbi:MAG: hypothetical protein RL463_1298 [Bacteroidota bacterium]|jgi:uncharacterized protein (TIGR00290 family)
MQKIKAYMNWSGGKDSSLALYKILKSEQFEVTELLTSINEAHDRISMHGVRTDLLRLQAEHIDIPLSTIQLPAQPSMEIYESIMHAKITELKLSGTVDTIFGDIFLEDLRQYREEKLSLMGIRAHFPLWKTDTTMLMQEFISLGFKAIVVCVNGEVLDKSFCGRIIDQSFVNDLPSNVDVCGENGEYHSFVFDGPIFKKPVPFKIGEIVHRSYQNPNTATNNVCHTTPEKIGFYFCDLIVT